MCVCFHREKHTTENRRRTRRRTHTWCFQPAENDTPSCQLWQPHPTLQVFCLWKLFLVSQTIYIFYVKRYFLHWQQCKCDLSKRALFPKQWLWSKTSSRLFTSRVRPLFSLEHRQWNAICHKFQIIVFPVIMWSIIHLNMMCRYFCIYTTLEVTFIR